jgi:uncharacterized RDD family membrane protein YckC
VATDVDPRAETLAAATAGAEAAARTLTEGGQTTPRVRGSDELIGRHLAHFRIEKRLGHGGMGEVFLATDLALDRPVAVKVLGREIAEDSVFRDRFVREARAQARVNHPNICHIYFIGEQDGRLFFAMEYVEGENLQARIERLGKLPYADAVDLARQAAAGLAEAQKHGFTHRDVKPSNLLVDKNGVVKVADFGLVKDAGRAEVADTGGTAIVGTPLYMAPEQARGEPVDFRADIYALGVTLHHMVAGAPPFTAPTPLAVVSRHLSDPRPKLAETARGVALVDALLDRMMAKRPEQRFASYDDLLSALEQASPRVTRPAGGWARAFALGIDMGLILLASALVGGGLSAMKIEAEGWLLGLFVALYFVAANAVFGRTYGKRALELSILVEGGRAGIGWRRSIVRFLAQWGPIFVTLIVGNIFQQFVDREGGVYAFIEGVSWVLGLAPMIIGGLIVERSAGKRAYWDRIAGTRVVYQRN